MSRVGVQIRIVASLLLVSGLMAFAPAAEAATLVVTKTADTNDGVCDADCSLREAVADANSGPATEVIRIPSGTYPLTEGELLINLHVVIEGAPQAVITRAAGTAGRIFNISGGISATFRNLEITGGFVPHSGSTFDDNGGAIRNLGTLTLEGVSVHHNVANDEGGGIWSTGGSLASPGLVIRDSRVSSNEAQTRLGGGVLASTLVIEDSEVSDNVATGVSGSAGGVYVLGGEMTMRRTTVARNVSNLGGGIYGNSALQSTIEDSLISRNTASGGGGIHWTNGPLTVRRTAISSNEASGGGGISVSSGSALVESSTVSNNAATTGGGLFANSGNFELDNTTVSGNNALSAGGGIGVQNTASAEAVRTTITNNTADWDSSNGVGEDGGGVFVGGVATFKIDGSILAGNHDDSTSTSHRDCSGPVTAAYTVFGDQTGCTVTSTNSTEDDPELGPLNDNGGPTETHAISAAGPARDFFDTPGCGTTDQRGAPRPDVADCDAGAYELVTCQGVTANVIGSPTDDSLEGTNGDDGVLAFAGNDTVTTHGGNDTVCAGDGNDIVFGGDGEDTLLGEVGKDKLYGEGGADALDGGAGKRDKCFGGAGQDTFAKCDTKKQQGV